MVSKNGITDLMIAGSDGDLATVNALLATDADVNARTVFGQTALMFASKARQASIVLALLKKGADTSIKSNLGATALDWALDEDHHHVVQILKNSALLRAVRDGDLPDVERLISLGADVNSSSDDGWTTLRVGPCSNFKSI